MTELTESGIRLQRIFNDCYLREFLVPFCTETVFLTRRSSTPKKTKPPLAFHSSTMPPPPTNSNESYCTFTLASDVTAGGLPSEEEIMKDLENNDANVRMTDPLQYWIYVVCTDKICS